VWRQALDEEPRLFLIVLPDCVLAGDDGGGIACLAADSGQFVWKTKLPATEEGEQPFALAAAERDGKVVVIASDDRFLLIDPAQCRSAGDRCVAPSGGLKSTETPIELYLMRDGTRVTVMDKWLIHHDAKGERISVLVMREIMGMPSFGEDGSVTVVYDEHLGRIRPERCRVADDEKIALDDRTEERVAPPAGCVERLAKIDEIALEAPVVLGGDVVFTADRELRRKGKIKWTSAVDAAGNPVKDAERDEVYVPCWKETDDVFVQIVDLCAVGVDSGRTVWRSPLGLPKAGLLGVPIVIDGGDWLFVHLRDQVAAMRKPARPGAPG
jgi:hypothetical protein